MQHLIWDAVRRDGSGYFRIEWTSIAEAGDSLHYFVDWEGDPIRADMGARPAPQWHRRPTDRVISDVHKKCPIKAGSADANRHMTGAYYVLVHPSWPERVVHNSVVVSPFVVS